MPSITNKDEQYYVKYEAEINSVELQIVCEQMKLHLGNAEPRAKTNVHVHTNRGGARVVELENGRKVLLRNYMRGGFVSKFVRNTFLRLPFASVASYRPFQEFEISLLLKDELISVPRAIAAMVKTRFAGSFYEGNIAYEYIPNSINLLEFWATARGDHALEARFSLLCKMAGQESRKMLEKGVFHSDLHLGNILVEGEGKIYLIDFDKAVRYARNSNVSFSVLKKMGLRTIKRWTKSAMKHGAADLAIKPFVEGLDIKC